MAGVATGSQEMKQVNFDLLYFNLDHWHQENIKMIHLTGRGTQVN